MDQKADDIEAKVIGIVKEMLVKDEVRPEQKFASLGADEIDMMAIVIELEDEYSISIDDSMLDTRKTTKGLIDYIRRAITNAAIQNK
jgi:acyl carrier protein